MLFLFFLIEETFLAGFMSIGMDMPVKNVMTGIMCLLPIADGASSAVPQVGETLQ